jgi:hypothetical protein
MERSEQLDKLATALADAQGEFPVIPKEANNPFFKSKYADLASIIKTIQPVLAKHGLSVVHTLEDADTGIRVRTTLLHKSGQFLSGVMQMRPTKDDPQAFGSATTYAKRYGLSAVLNLATDEDDDGNAASAPSAKVQQYAKPKPQSQPQGHNPKAIWEEYVHIFAGDQPLAKGAIQALIGNKPSKEWTDEDMVKLAADIKERKEHVPAVILEAEGVA